MTQDDYFSCAADSSPTLGDAHVESFLARLKELGYAACKFRDKRRITEHFVAWTQTLRVPATDVTESHVIAYLELSNHLSKERLASKRALLLAFLRHLRKKGVASSPKDPKEITPAKRIEQDYADYLQDERGLSFRSLLVYLPLIDVNYFCR